jgi:hypothetical protein
MTSLVSTGDFLFLDLGFSIFDWILGAYYICRGLRIEIRNPKI